MRIVVALRSWIAAATRAKSLSRSRSRSSASGCSWISARKRVPAWLGVGAAASEGDTVRAFHQDALELELLAQYHDVRRQPDGQPPDGRIAEHARGHVRCRPDRLLEGCSERVQVPHRVEHGQGASCELAVRTSCDAVLDLYVETAEAVRAVAEPCSGHRIGDERDATSSRPPDDVRGLGREVDAVEDDLHDHVVASERRASDAGIPMPEGPHRVEEVRHRAHAEVEGRLRLFGRRVRVPARDGDLSEQQAPDERLGSRELGRESDEPDGPRVEKPLEQLDVGIATRRRGMNPETAGREEGALQVNPEDPRPVGAARHPAESGEEPVFRSGDEGRQVRGDPGLEQSLAGSAVSLHVGIEQVDAGETVDLQVDEAGNRDSLSVRRGAADRADAPATHLHVAADQTAVDECGFDSELHSPSAGRRASRMLPDVVASRSCASSASTPARIETIATFALPPAAARASSTRSFEAPVAVWTIRGTRARSFSFVALTSTIRFPKVLPSRIIETVEIEFRSSFCAEPALSRVEPARNSGPTTALISWSARSPSSDSSTDTTQAVQAPARDASSTAPSTKGVRPLALTPTTASSGPTPSSRTAAAPASRSSSAASCSSGVACSPPAWSATTCPGSVENVDWHSAASSSAIRPDDPAPT